MKKALSLVIFIIFSIILASVENKVKADICHEGLGNCNQCDERCKAKHGPTAQGDCNNIYQICTCNYDCGPPPPAPPRRQCSGGTGLCDTKCGNPCCNLSCARKYPGGSGFCDNSLGHTLLCQCQYPC
ncbi:hypothetical protein EUTSA_v10027387mg [Eutrema salsugineum]|uniref:Defensin-like protein n=1 Tax=Eutrema salsugineum TaxID=72664 RepID=V4MG19_EUTSA|nr:defensin-like protein 183 [Eutrema salsugineum]ESQ54217.1 hypothetical protein EUTSA_v10027387mg [Eutrema salsugineum]